MLEANKAAPLALAALFEPHMHLLALDADAAAAEFLASGGGQAPPLEEYAAKIDAYRAAADAIWATCTDDVRTGENA